jgi:predicted dehydrogenase
MTLKLGIIGTGIFFQKKHFPVLCKNSSLFSVNAIYTSRQEKFQNFKRSFSNAVWFSDVGELLKQDIDAVIVCVPIPQHEAVGEKVLRAGKHMLIEKPLSFDLQSAGRLVRVAQENKCRMMVAESYRYIKSFQWLKDVLKNPQWGGLKSVHVELSSCFDETNPYYQTKWRVNPQGYPGILWDGGIHSVSMLRDLFGDFTVESKHLSSRNNELGSFDTVSARLRFKNDVVGVYDLSYSAPPKGEYFLTVEFSRATAKANLNSAFIEHNGIVEKFSDTSDVYEVIYREFYDYVCSEREPAYPAREACRDLELLKELVCGDERRA